jgi:prephenate dehydratase
VLFRSKDAAIQQALAHLGENATFLKVLGSYPKATAVLKEFEK